MKVLLGICSSIAAYKSLELIRLLKKDRADIKVILTKSALNFVTPLTCQTLSGNEVYIDQFILTKGIKHLSLSEWADILVIAPATANIIGKANGGIGDDLLSTTILSFQKSILFVPAMDKGMWNNKIVQRNVGELKKYGYHFLEPEIGPLASGKIGKGRFPQVSLIHKKILSTLGGFKSLEGKKFLVTGGRTEENLDSVRVITNRSSGMMAKELMNAIICRDGRVKGIFGEVNVSLPEGIEIFRAKTSKEMLQHLKKNIGWCDCLIMASAVGDYKPKSMGQTKIHSTKVKLEFMKNKDLLKEVSKDKNDKIFIGFSLEDKINLKRAMNKLTSKNLDFIVANSVDAIGSKNMKAQILKNNGKISKVGNVSKWKLANRILDQYIIELKSQRSRLKKRSILGRR